MSRRRLSTRYWRSPSRWAASPASIRRSPSRGSAKTPNSRRWIDRRFPRSAQCENLPLARRTTAPCGGGALTMRKAVAALLLLGALIGGTDVSAAEIKVLTAGAFKSVVMAVAPGFERQTGPRGIVDNDTPGALPPRIAGGEAFDAAPP